MSQPPQSGSDEKSGFDKGDRAAILDGKEGVGQRGEVFWIGENKYGPGMRYGLRADNGKTYWVDEANLGDEKDAPEPPPRPEAPTGGPVFERGDRVSITGDTKGQGISGAVFWVGESRYSKQPRYGVKGDDEETYWVDHNEVSAEAGDGAEGGAPNAGAGGPGGGGGQGGGGGANTNRGSARRSGGAAAQQGGGPVTDDEPPPAGPRPFDAAPPTDDDLPPEAFMDEQPADDFGDEPDEDLPF